MQSLKLFSIIVDKMLVNLLASLFWMLSFLFSETKLREVNDFRGIEKKGMYMKGVT